MKELKTYYKHYETIYPELSSFMHFLKAVRHTEPNDRILTKGFDELVDKKEYLVSERRALLNWMKNNNGA
jgi:hypothetical protein